MTPHDSFFLTRISGLALVLASLVKGPHERGATSLLIEAVFVDTYGPTRKAITPRFGEGVAARLDTKGS